MSTSDRVMDALLVIAAQDLVEAAGYVERLRERMGHVEDRVMNKVDTAIAVSFGLPHDQLV